MVDSPGAATAVWARLAPLVPPTWPAGWRAVGLNERLRFLRYEPGEYRAAQGPAFVSEQASARS